MPETGTVEIILAGDIVRTRKKHPCGSDLWTVIRTGADIKIRCNTCGRMVMMDRETFLKRRKELVSRPLPLNPELFTSHSRLLN